MRALAALALGLWLTSHGAATADPWEDRAPDTIRVASFNVGLVRKGAGLLVREIDQGSPQVDAIAEILLHVRPDILVLQKFDRDPAHRALARFAERLRSGVNGVAGLDYPFLYQGPVNAGLPSGLDLDGDGRIGGPGDAYGYGRFPGQYGMALLSRLPIDYDRIRTFQRFPWAGLPDADRPILPDGNHFHPDEVWQAMRLSSISHWDVPMLPREGEPLHVLAAHPTPPVFDGPEDRNGRRNGDEIRLLEAMVEGGDWLVDDRGGTGGLKPGASFVIAADLNADPNDGEASAAIAALLAHPRIADPAPVSSGAALAPQAGANAAHTGPSAQDTADWRDEPGPGNMRVDYVLPSVNLTVTGAGVFWPAPDHPLARLVAPDPTGGRRPASSDHRLVWVDIAIREP